MAQLPTGGTLTSTAKTSIPAPVRARQQAIDATVEYLTYLFTLPQTRLAWMGDGMGGLIVGDRQRTFYVRVGGATGEVAEAKCIIPLLNPRINDKCLIRKEIPGGLAGFVIIDYYGTLLPDVNFCDVVVFCTGIPIVQSQYTVDTRSSQDACMAVNLNYAFVFVQSGTGPDNTHLYVIHASDPTAPVQVGEYDFLAADAGGLYDAYYCNNTVVLSFNYQGTLFWGWQILSVADPTNPNTSFGANIDSRYDGRFIELFLVGLTLYMITNYVAGSTGVPGTKGFFIANAGLGSDTSDTVTADIITSFNVSNLFFYGCLDNGDFIVYELTVPATPVARGSIASAFGTGECIKASGGYAWVGDSSTNELVGIDVSDPDSPVVTSTTALSAEPKAIDVCDTHLYLSLADGTVAAYDITDPTNPTDLHTDVLTNFDSIVKAGYIGNGKFYALGYDTGTSETTLGILNA